MHVFLYSSRVGEVPKDVARDGSGGLKTDDHEHGGAMTGPGGDGCDTESQGVAHRVAPWLGTLGRDGVRTGSGRADEAHQTWDRVEGWGPRSEMAGQGRHFVFF